MKQGRKYLEIKKVLNNNVVVTNNELNQEMVVMGRGLALRNAPATTKIIFQMPYPRWLHG